MIENVHNNTSNSESLSSSQQRILVNVIVIYVTNYFFVGSLKNEKKVLQWLVDQKSKTF